MSGPDGQRWRQKVYRYRLLAASLLTLVAACAPSLSTFQSAAVAPAGHYSAAVALEGSLPTGSLYDTIDTARGIADKAAAGQAITTNEKWQAFGAGMQLLLSPPSVGTHLALAYVPVRRF